MSVMSMILVNNELPAMSLIPPVVIVAVYVVEYNRGCDGTNVANGVPGLGRYQFQKQQNRYHPLE